MFTSSDWFTFLATATAIIITTVSCTWWLSSQFSLIRSLIYTSIDQLKKEIVTKLEYHERHDDQRFSNVHMSLDQKFDNLNKDLWSIRVRNAARDQEIAVEKAKNNRD